MSKEGVQTLVNSVADCTRFIGRSVFLPTIFYQNGEQNSIAQRAVNNLTFPNLFPFHRRLCSFLHCAGIVCSLTVMDDNNILNTGMDCGFWPPLLLGEGWGEGFQKSANCDRSQYS